MVALQWFAFYVLVVFSVKVISGTAGEKEYDFEYDSMVADSPDYYYYGDSDYYSYYELALGNTTLHKCLCGLDEIWTGKVCEKQETIAVVLDPFSDFLTAVNTTAFGNVIIDEVVCPKGTSLYKLGLDEKNPDYFYILESGELNWNARIISNYCIEHIYSSIQQSDDLNAQEATQQGIAWYAQICLDPPTLPSCCPNSYSMSPGGSCIKSSNFNFLPPIRLSNNSLVWPSVMSDVLDISCKDSQDELILKLDNKTVTIEYHPNKPQLRWSSPIVVREHQVTANYCIGVEAGSESKPKYLAKLCYKDPHKEHEEICQGKTCVRKCCEQSQVLTLGSCVPVPEENFTQLFNLQYHDSSHSEIEDPENISFVYGFPLCKKFYMLEPDDTFHLLENGYLHTPTADGLVSPKSYCIDAFFDQNVNDVRMLALVCFDSDKSPICRAVQTYLYPALLIISIIFLAITLFVYLCVAELHAKVHGKCLLSHILALLLAYLNLLIVQQTTEILGNTACKFMASVMHFSFLSAFFWLNVMCFDIWWTLKSMRPVPETGELSRLRFKLYSLYSWGCPLIITVVSVVVQNLPEDVNVIRPNFGKSTCWFNDKKSLWAYFYGFVLIIVIANIIFFCQVAYILIVAQNDPILQRTRQQNRERMWLYVKLFLVMGITWLAEIISWQEDTCEVWIFTDIINSLQGVSIFIIFICKRNLLKKVRGRWEPYLRHVKEVVGSKRLSHSRFSTSGTRHTAREQLSFSSSENRPNHSSASRKTVESQLSIDPSSNRKISTGSLTSTTGVQIHNHMSMPMDTIQELATPESGPNHMANGSVTAHVTSPFEETGTEKSNDEGILETTLNELNGNKKEDFTDVKDEDINHNLDVPDEKVMEKSVEVQNENNNSNLDNDCDTDSSDNEKANESDIGDIELQVNDEGNESVRETEPQYITDSNPKLDDEETNPNNIAVPPVQYPKNRNSGDNYVYSYSRENPGFAVDEEDEPIEV